MTPEQRMISRLCGCLRITLRKYKVAGITVTDSLLDEALAMVPETTECPVCSHLDTIDNGTACAYCGCDRELTERDETYTGDIQRDDSVFPSA